MDLRHSNMAGAAPALQRTGTATGEQRAPEIADRTVRTDLRGEPGKSAPGVSGSSREALGYGMPCARCHLYYPASLDACPCCNSKERVSASAAPAIPRPAVAAEAQLNDAALEKEREAFLQQFKSQMVAVADEATKVPAVCSLSRQHPETFEPASVCKPCFEQLQQRVDVLEAALHIDLKEAAQIVYQAVWADPSDPAKTYANAAAALLNELHRRGGLATILGPFQQRGN
jgi:hypothetical protein